MRFHFIFLHHLELGCVCVCVGGDTTAKSIGIKTATNSEQILTVAKF